MNKYITLVEPLDEYNEFKKQQERYGYTYPSFEDTSNRHGKFAKVIAEQNDIPYIEIYSGDPRLAKRINKYTVDDMSTLLGNVYPDRSRAKWKAGYDTFLLGEDSWNKIHTLADKLNSYVNKNQTIDLDSLDDNLDPLIKDDYGPTGIANPAEYMNKETD